jgi:putative ABC transport system permease protein
VGWKNYLRQFLRDLRSQKLRAALTMFGLVWGTTAVTLLLAFGEGLQARLIKNIRGLGENIVICWPARTSKAWEGLPRNRRIVVKDDDIAALKREVPGLTAISGEYSTGNKKFKVGHKVIVPGVTGASPIFAAMRNLIPQAGGRYIDDLGIDERRRVVFLGDGLKHDLFGDADAVGQYVTINGMPFLVVGVMQKKEQDSS